MGLIEFAIFIILIIMILNNSRKINALEKDKAVLWEHIRTVKIDAHINSEAIKNLGVAKGSRDKRVLTSYDDDGRAIIKGNG